MAFPFRTLLMTGAALAMLHAGIPGAAAQGAGTESAAISPAGATAAEVAVRNWLSGLLGPSVPVAKQLVQMTPAGDHYDVVVPMRNLTASDATPNAGPIQITATARPLAGGKWSIENIKTPSPLDFTLDMPVPAADGKPATTEPVHYTINMTGQDSRAQLDPSLATPSTYTGASEGVTAHAEGPSLRQDTKIGRMTSMSSLQSAGADRVDVNSEGTAQHYTIASTKGDTPPMQISMDTVRAKLAMTGISRGHGVAMIQNSAGLLMSMAPTPSGTFGRKTKLAPELLAGMLAALQDLASEANLDESIEGLTVKVADVGVAMSRARLGFGAKSDAGILHANMELGLDGLKLDGLPLDGMEALVPSAFAIRPYVTGARVADVIRMLTVASKNEKQSPADVAALFSHGGITTGVESMSLALGGAMFTGQAKFLVRNPQVFNGTAQITAEHFDDLVEKVNGMPQLAQAVPVLALAKGLGKSVDNKLLWNVSYQDGKLLVNNVDVLAMAGGGHR